MIVAVIAVRMVQPAVHKIVDVVTMRHRLVSAARAVLVGAVRFRRAVHRVCRGDLDDMLVDMIIVHMVKMTIVQIIDMAVMTYRSMSAVRAVNVSVIGMMLLRTGRHLAVLSLTIFVESSGVPACPIAPNFGARFFHVQSIAV